MKGVKAMSKRQARKSLAATKPGLTVKEFLAFCDDMGFWFDEVMDDSSGLLLEIYNTLTKIDN